MDTIKNYLDSTFNSFPQTKAVEDVKAEMLEMMEEKFQELRNEGKPEHEAIAIVISEFGNMDELKESLGIKEDGEVNYYGKEEIDSFIRSTTRNMYMIALGVMTIIMSFIFPILFEENRVGPAIMFVFWALGVGLIVFSEVGKPEKLTDKEGQLSDEIRRELTAERNQIRYTDSIILALGIMLCVLSFIPTILFETEWSPAIFMFIVAIGVGLIIMSSARKKAYDELFRNKKRRHYDSYKNPSVKKIMSLYWSTVTCVYLCYSFITFDWARSWIIWPIAGIVSSLVRVIFDNEEE